MAAARRSWSSLLPDILQEIFYKTPAEALVRAKPTCKEWYALLTDASFINEHFQRSQEERFLRIFVDDTVEIMDPATATSSVSPVPDELRQHPYKITLVHPLLVHCDGLMLVAYDDDCCCVSDGSRLPNLALWNPVLKNLRWVEPAKGITSSDYHGIGYDKNNRSDGYKILRFNSCPWDDVEGYGDAPEVEMYECKTCSWRTLDVELDMDVHIMRICVAVMGNMYWIAYRDVEEEEGDDDDEEEEEFILSFDFSDETFKDICFCPPSYENYQLGCLDGDSLSLLQQDQASGNIEVWVSSKLGDGDVTFSKCFSLSGPVLPALWVDADAASPVYCFVKPN
uniref:F-box associated beta-propeller type 1 domain-containing protein n=1 Tax=Brassica oleracea var. oleracea TaxID=109376 RepID=A0A0D3BAK0_BRAOL